MAETFNLPPEWNDNERMRFLLSPFPPNVAIKYDDSKVKFWRSLIINSCKQLKKISFTEDQLLERFCWNTFRPRCLGPVLEAMLRHGDIQKKSDWNGSNEGWIKWSANVLSKPVSWLWRSPAATSCDEEYVLIGPVKEVAETITLVHQRGVVYQNTDNVMSAIDYHHLCERFVLPECADIVTRHLLREGKLAEATVQGNTQVIKFTPHGGGVTKMDLQIMQLKQAISKMSACVERLREETFRLRTDALSKYKHHDQSAVGILRRAKIRSAMLQKRVAVLDNLNGILERIQSAETDALILSAYNEGLEALKKIKLDDEAIAVVMDELQEVMRDNEEVSQTLAQGVTGVCEEVEEEDLLKELEALLLDDQVMVPGDQDTLEETFASLKITDTPRGLTTPLGEKEVPATPLRKQTVCTPLKGGQQTTPLKGEHLMEDHKRKQKPSLQSPVLA